MSEQKQNERCSQCNGELSGPFCSLCGHPQELKRIDVAFVLSEIGSVLNFQKGVLFTMKELLIKPGDSVKRFIHEDRNRLVKPISFVVLCSLIYIVTQQLLGFNDGYMNFSGLDWGNSTVTVIMDWISKNYGFANILMATFIAIWAKIFFRKYDYNFFETLILLYFAMGIQMLMFSALGIIEYLTQLSVLDAGSSIAIIYVCWAIGQFFDRKKKMNYLKGFLSYILGMISFMIIAIVCGSLIDLMVK